MGPLEYQKVTKIYLPVYLWDSSDSSYSSDSSDGSDSRDSSDRSDSSDSSARSDSSDYKTLYTNKKPFFFSKKKKIETWKLNSLKKN